jgi:Protein of unknown function (DUF2934)
VATRSDKPSTRKSRAGAKASDAVKVNPATNRAPNADEAAPETLVPDIVRTHLTQETAPSQSPEVERARLVAERAYELAEQRGFTPGAELDDWLQAEREYDAKLREQTPPEDQFTG